MDCSSLLTVIFKQVLQNTLWASALGVILALAWRWPPGWSRYGLGLLVVCRLMMPAPPASPLSAANWWRAATPRHRRIRLPRRELDALETFITQIQLAQPVAVFELTTQGMTKSNDGEAKILTETDFTDFLKAAFKKHPGTIIRLQCRADIDYSKVTAAWTKSAPPA